MKYYLIKKQGSLLVKCEENFWQSILADMATILVVIVCIGMDIMFSIYVTHSWIIDLFVVFMILSCFYARWSKKLKPTSKEELHKMIDDMP